MTHATVTKSYFAEDRYFVSVWRGKRRTLSVRRVFPDRRTARMYAEVTLGLPVKGRS